MNEILVGNVCSLCAMVSDSISGTRKKHSQILAVQILSQFFYGAGSISTTSRRDGISISRKRT